MNSYVDTTSARHLAAFPEHVAGTPVRDRAERAIASAFPTGRLQSVEPLHGGMSGSLIHKITVDDVAYVMRHIVQPTPMMDPARQFACMRIAADLGVSPALIYADAMSGVSISAFVTPIAGYVPGAVPRDAAELGTLLRRLHQGPAFPTFLDAFQMIERGRGDLATSGVVLPALVRELLAQYDVVARAVSPHTTSVPCHNDLNPGNVLCDGERQWLIDFDAACMGDPLFDVAGLLHWFALDETRTDAMLRAYFNDEPTPHDRAKLRLMEQVSWTFYALLFLLISRGADGLGDLDAISRDTLPSFTDALRMIPRGELKLHEAESRRWFALVMAKQSLSDMARPEFAAALAL